ncbi:MAG: V-type ATP synthase subunit F [Candidatus Nezhaarchaeota archaeon]|nr:V-type ATP synthase subunit F [Candidatus Nezhaarchaeota archaeon]
MKIVAVGCQDFVAGLRLVGVSEGYVAQGPQDVDNVLSAIVKKPDIMLVLVEERYAAEMPNFYDKYLKLKRPAVAIVPSGKTGEGVRDYMSELIKRTIGVEVTVK